MNNQQDPVMARLDRFLVSIDWECNFPLSFINMLPRDFSDHAPLVLDLGLNRVRVNKPFRFELSWFLRGDLKEVVSKVWSTNFVGRTILDKWQNRGRKLRSMLKGWDINYQAFYKKQKVILSAAIDEIDKESESIGLTAEKYFLRKSIEANLNVIRKEEQVKWFQRAKSKDLLQGDSLTPYFMAKASGRKSKSRITSLLQDGGLIVGEGDILKYATSYYKNLFGPVVNNTSISLDVVLENVLSESDRIKLEKPFSLEEIEFAVFNMKHNKSPGPDGLPIEFYQYFWHLVRDDLFALFESFYERSLDLSRFNYGLITLLPKCVDASKIQQYRPICLLNVIFKFFLLR